MHAYNFDPEGKNVNNLSSLFAKVSHINEAQNSPFLKLKTSF